MSKIKFNKMVKSLSIKDGNRFIGIVDLQPFKEFVNSDKMVESFNQVDGNCKSIVISKLSFNRMKIEKGKICYGYINTKDFLEYLNNDILDIKEFQKIN